MEKEYLITFCWMLKLPQKIKLNGEIYYLTERQVIVDAKDSKDAFAKLKGSSHDVLSSVTDILCTQ